MGEKNLNTILKIRYDTYDNWMSVDPILRQGEIAIVLVESENNDVQPVVLSKTGNGTNKFSLLPWNSANAADVYDWAKQVNKPTYIANEVNAVSYTENQTLTDEQRQTARNNIGVDGISTSIDNIVNGTTIVGKANADANGNVINTTYANALKGNKSGKSIAITDISPIRHKMTVKVSGGGDLTRAKVKIHGKNLIDFFDISSQQSITYTADNGSSITKTGYLLEGLSPGEKYTISFSFNPNKFCDWLYFYDIDENWILPPVGYTNYLTTSQVENNPKTFTAAEGHHYFITRGGQFTITQSEINSFKTFQVEHGSTKTEYEPYMTYIPNEDGTVDNVTSIYPNMTIYTKTDGVTIDCEYNRDINKAFVDASEVSY